MTADPRQTTIFRTGEIEFDPAANPAVLDTLTWNEDAAADAAFSHHAPTGSIAQAAVNALDGGDEAVRRALAAFVNEDFRVVRCSCAVRNRQAYFLMRLPDGQKVFLSVARTDGGGGCELPVIREAKLGASLARVCPVNTDSVAKFVEVLAPHFAPRGLGAIPRLGIGNRQTVTVWPGIIQAVSELGLPAEIIQNSAYRELAPMSFILSPQSAEAAYLPGHGSLSIGHTGTSIEGLWLNGVISVIEAGFSGRYGADLDHVPVKSLDAQGLAKAKHLLKTGRHYTFFTLDTSALFDLAALKLSGQELASAFERAVPDPTERKDILSYYRSAGKPYLPRSEDDAMRVAAAYGASIRAAADMFEHIESLKNDEPFDFEFSLDEGPDITTPMEMAFCLEELNRRGVTVHFVAPNVGFEKRVDYRKPDGLRGLEARVREMSRIAGEYGALLDFHSGSDKSAETYRTISRAADGRLKLKVSGKLQIMMAEVLADLDPDFFNWWWDWTLETARREAAGGSGVAAVYVGKVEERMKTEGQSFARLPSDQFFTDFCFSAVGARDERGNFLFRERFYRLPQAILDEYTHRVSAYVKELARDLGLA